jgi:hypothetical protein
MTTIGAPLLLLCLPAAADTPAPKFPLGKDTTYVTGPLDKEGYIDYQAALNDRLGKGVTPEKNANVLLWKALGPTPEGGKGVPPEYFKRLGVARPPRGGAYFIRLSAHLKAPPGSRALEAAFDQLIRARQRPWAAKDYPHLAAWLKANEKPLAVAVEATRRPDYFNPLVPWRTEHGPGGLMDTLIPVVAQSRELANALAARAMLRVAEGKFDEAWQDLLACHRLGRLVARGGFVIEGLVGIAIDQIASTADLTYLERANLTSRQAQDRLKDLQGLPPFPPMADKVDLAERFVYLELVQRVRRGGLGELAGGKARKPTPEELKALERIDWLPALRNGNRWYDRLAAALRIEGRPQREKALDKLDEELKARKNEAARLAELAKLGLGDEKSAGKAIGDILVGVTCPALRKVQSAHDRAEQGQRNLHVAFALAAYRRDRGRYPATLNDLVPRYLAVVPGDLFSGKPLVYRPSAEGYVLSSVGVPEPVRMPLPELKPKK